MFVSYSTTSARRPILPWWKFGKNDIGFVRRCLQVAVCSLVVSSSLLVAQETSGDLKGKQVSVVKEDASSGAMSIPEAIDRFLREEYKKRKITEAPRCSDRTFVRRLYLDLAGRVPTPAEASAFLEDGAAQRRVRLIDALLSSEDHVVHLVDLLDTLLMGRAGEDKYEQRITHQWRKFLEASVRRNQPWDEFIEEILLARPASEEKRGAVWFLYERGDDFQKIAESVAPAVFGVRIECAQCHDHMMVDEIKQSHYWGLVAFFNRGKNVKPNGKASVSESAIGGFSEFANLLGDSTPNHLTFLDVKVVPEARPDAEEKQEDADELYLPSESDHAVRVPKFSRREKFVSEVVRNHPRVAPALVNRIWAIFMGRGIVHPYDEMDSMHDPSHPELLAWLAEDFVTQGHDVRRLIRGIVMSNAYQLDSKHPDGLEDPASFAWYLERSLTGEQLARSMQVTLRGVATNESSVVGLFRQQFPEVLPNENVVTVQDGLFFSNNPSLDELIQSSSDPSHLVPRVRALALPAAQVQMLFQTIFARPASADEVDRISAYLKSRDGSEASIQQVVWSMLTSAEFRFNH